MDGRLTTSPGEGEGEGEEVDVADESPMALALPRALAPLVAVNQAFTVATLIKRYDIIQRRLTLPSALTASAAALASPQAWALAGVWLVAGAMGVACIRAVRQQPEGEGPEVRWGLEDLDLHGLQHLLREVQGARRLSGGQQ